MRRLILAVLWLSCSLVVWAELPVPLKALPAHGADDQIVTHATYVLQYNEEREQADWVIYVLTAEMLKGDVDRTDDFRPDPSVKTGSASLADYKGSGYDRGHLLPAADRKYSRQAMSETFYLSNMSPQLPGFNRGIWSSLESAVRGIAETEKGIIVVTGPIYQGEIKTIGGNRVAVPTGYYKVICDFTPPEFKMIGFILPNASSKAALTTFAVTVDKVEEVTGIDFFAGIDDETEEALESSLDLSKWVVKPGRTFGGGGSGNGVQCKGVTKAGHRCGNQTGNENGYCHLHQDQAPDYQEEPEDSEATPGRKYWLNTTGNVRHNDGCRYYKKTSKGRECGPDEGKPCGICGGSLIGLLAGLIALWILGRTHSAAPVTTEAECDPAA